MGKSNSEFLFNLIAPVYGLFYHKQKKRFTQVIQAVQPQLDLRTHTSILDVGCGTGALCSVLHGMGLCVTGVDPAEKMLSTAQKKPENSGITFINANATERLPFGDKQFDISIASYVAHGMGTQERQRLYAEMSRVSSAWVIIYDYNQNRNAITSFVEWLEGGDYFHFIQHAEGEMKNCRTTASACFSEVRVVDVDAHAAWYICKPSLR